MEPIWAAAYAELPGFPRATVPGHAGRLVLGRLEGRSVGVLAGRFHPYEGYATSDVVAGVRLLHELGASLLLVTNASGSLDPRLEPGTFLLLRDHLSFQWGPGGSGPRAGPARRPLPETRAPYDRELLRLLGASALAEDLPVAEGVYAAMPGPSYETRAEIAFLRRCGARAVGMSTVPEVIAARERGLRVAGVSCLTNYAAGLSPGRLGHDEVIEGAALAAPRLERLIRAFLRRLPR